MATVDSTIDNVYFYDGTLVSLNGTLIVSAFTEQPPGNLIYEDTDGDMAFEAGETATWNGDAATFIGSGTATVGITIGIFTINLGSSVDVNAFSTAAGSFFEYPDGQPAELFDGLVTQILSTPLIGSTLSALGLADPADLLAYVEQNALLTFNLNAGGGMVTCFDRSTLITTPNGLVPIYELRVGDLVLTMDHGFQAVRWHGKRQISATGRFAPVVIMAGALSNTSDLIVSPQHRILLLDWRAEIIAGTREVFCPAVHLVNDHSVRRKVGGMVEYHHIMFDRHEVIYGNGVPSESFHPGEMAMSALDQIARAELLSIFPELYDTDPAALPPLARPVASGPEGRMIAQMI